MCLFLGVVLCIASERETKVVSNNLQDIYTRLKSRLVKFPKRKLVTFLGGGGEAEPTSS